MRHLLIIHNPTAGPKSKARLEKVLCALGGEAISLELYPTKAAGDATRYLQKTTLPAETIVVAAGGDGTINEVLNGLIGKANPMAIIPLGTANVMAKNIQMPESASGVAQTLARGSFAPFYPAIVADDSGHKTRFGQVMSVGLDAQSVDTVDLSLKKKHGKLAYISAMLKQLPRSLSNTWQYQVAGSTDQHICSTLMISLGRYYGGKFTIAEAGDWQKPVLHILAFQKYDSPIKALAMQLLWMTALPLGLIEYMPGVETQDVNKLSIKEINLSYDSAPVQADGDVITRLPVTVEIEASPIQLLVKI